MAKRDDSERENARQENTGRENSGPDDSKSDNSSRDDSHFGKLATVGMEIAVGAGLGALVGSWIDRKWHCGPWGVLLGTFIGIAAGMYLLIKEGIKANKN